MSRSKDAGAFEAEVYRLRAQCKKRRGQMLAYRKVVDQCAEALEYAITHHLAGAPPFILTYAFGCARRLVPKK